MKARLYSNSPELFEVRDDTDPLNGWWIVAKIPGGYMICDLLSQIVSTSSELGQKIVAAIEAATCTDAPCHNRAHYELRG